jgi:hypothetical protein
VDVDGTDFRYLTGGYDSNMASWSPSWSPDGSRIAFSRVDYHCCGQGATQRVLSIRPNGTNQVQLWPGFSSFPPAWAPDGSRVLLSVCAGNPCENDLVLVDPNGGNPVQLTDDAGFQGHPDWQPIPVNSYPRPRAATLHQASLVPAYNVCGYPNHTHGPPLAFGSCNPPVQASHETTLGTPDSNGKPLKGEGKASYTTAANDVRITVEVADVYNRASLTDYTGELRLRSSLRITDKRNTSPVGGPTAATVSDTTVAATVPCTATGDPNQGASCLLSTTANAIAPGTVASGARTVWELGQTQVDDGGADGDADTAGDNARFMVQGVFVP